MIKASRRCAVRAGTTVGPAQAAAVMAEGLVGEAVTFLVRVKESLEDPARLVLDL